MSAASETTVIPVAPEFEQAVIDAGAKLLADAYALAEHVAAFWDQNAEYSNLLFGGIKDLIPQFGIHVHDQIQTDLELKAKAWRVDEVLAWIKTELERYAGSYQQEYSGVELEGLKYHRRFTYPSGRLEFR